MILKLNQKKGITMSKEKFGQKQSSTKSSKDIYELLIEEGYVPLLLEGRKPLHSLKWDTVRHNHDVSHSKSGNSIHLVDGTDQGRPLIDLKTSGMMSAESLIPLQRLTKVQLKPGL
jgi:hypothetical protein